MQITSEAILFQNEVYPIKNISSARMVERRRDYRISAQDYRKRIKRWLLAAAGVLVVYLLWRVLEALVGYWTVTSVIPFGAYLYYDWVWYLAIAAIVILAFRRPQRSHTEYGIELQTNSGNRSLFYSLDLAFMMQVRDAVFEALTTHKQGVNYVVNVDNSTIQDNSTTNFNTTYDYSVNFTHHTGLSPEQLAFLQKDFNHAMGELAKELARVEDPSVTEELKALRDAMAKPTPDVGLLRRSWGRLKGLAEVYTVSGSVLDVVGRGVSFFLA